jgi:hypothetical protein
MADGIHPPALTNEDWEEVQLQIPKRDDPVIQKYMTGREALISEEKKQRSGQSACLIYVIS